MRTAHRTFVRVDKHRPEVMHWALGRRRAASGPVLRVYALGTFRIERRGIPIYQLGGPKAGNRQAAGLFAFLFDRAERGATKDEIIDMIWPDVPMECADTAFHRTLGGLRRTLITGQVAEPIRLQNDRYRLARRLWSSC